MGDQSSQEINLWSNLPTVTSFDRGISLRSTRCIGESEKSGKDKKIVKKMSASTIVISSLLKQLCGTVDNDIVYSKKLYFLLCDAMHKMKVIDISYKAEGFEIIQEKYMTAVYRLINVAKATFGSDSPISRPLITYISPYQDQFQETGFIASGGFGNVFKAVHKLDEVEYAIKKIIVKPKRVSTLVKHLEEVKTLAKLNHTNIVSYKQAWIEPMTTCSMQQLPSTSKSKSDSESYESRVNCNIENTHSENQSYSYKSYESKKSNQCYDEQSYSVNKIIVSKDTRTSESNSDIVSFRDYSCDISENIVEVNSRTSTEESITSEESVEDCRVLEYSHQTPQYAILYIQMSLCEKTLRQWIDERTEPTPVSLVAQIATQILSGLNYIHSLKIVHHDIKPSNIFITTSGKIHVQLGDFGLACPLQRESHDAIVGTCMYAAPEQLKGECNPKSDIYSLGIVLLELLIPMQTKMECIEMIKTLKTGEIPPTLSASYPQWAKIISQLIQINPLKRPSTDALLEDLRIDKDLIITRLEYENNILQNENKKKDQIIEDQKMKIQELQALLARLGS